MVFLNEPVKEIIIFVFFRKVHQGMSYAIKTIVVLAPNTGNYEQFQVDYYAPSRNL